jgi:hypothetical protein
MEAKCGNVPIVMLIPAQTDTRWFHDYIYYGKTEIRFLKGRLVFLSLAIQLQDQKGEDREIPEDM